MLSKNTKLNVFVEVCKVLLSVAEMVTVLFPFTVQVGTGVVPTCHELDPYVNVVVGFASQREDTE